MKRTELEVGAVLMHSTSESWISYPGSADEVTVLAVEPYGETPRSHRWSTTGGEPRVVAKGSGVLVERHGNQRIVQLRHLRGPWAACRDAQDQRARAARENAERLMQRRSLTTNTALMAADRGASRSLPARAGDNDERAEIVLPAAAFTAMLDALPATWRYTP